MSWHTYRFKARLRSHLPAKNDILAAITLAFRLPLSRIQSRLWCHFPFRLAFCTVFAIASFIFALPARNQRLIHFSLVAACFNLFRLLLWVFTNPLFTLHHSLSACRRPHWLSLSLYLRVHHIRLVVYYMNCNQMLSYGAIVWKWKLHMVPNGTTIGEMEIKCNGAHVACMGICGSARTKGMTVIV